MAAVKHLYTGYGDPNDNPDLELTGDAVGNHLYQDLDDDQAVWISTFYEDLGQSYHNGWQRMILAPNLALREVEVNSPDFEGQIGHAANGEMFVAMYDSQENTVRWRSMVTNLGGWYQGGLP